MIKNHQAVSYRNCGSFCFIFHSSSCVLLSGELVITSHPLSPIELKKNATHESAKLRWVKLHLLVESPRGKAHKLNSVSAGRLPSICLPRVLVAMSATFWKASKKAAAATTVVLKCKQITKAWGMSHIGKVSTAQRLKPPLWTQCKQPREIIQLDTDYPGTRPTSLLKDVRPVICC